MTPLFDFNDDGSVNHDDLQLWLLKAESLPGDANADGFVDGQDFLAWNNSKFTTGAGWSGGDFNADGTTDGSDFVIWNAFKFQGTRIAPVPVPEPNGHLALILALIGARSLPRY